MVHEKQKSFEQLKCTNVDLELDHVQLIGSGPSRSQKRTVQRGEPFHCLKKLCQLGPFFGRNRLLCWQKIYPHPARIQVRSMLIFRIFRISQCKGLWMSPLKFHKLSACKSLNNVSPYDSTDLRSRKCPAQIKLSHDQWLQIIFMSCCSHDS